MSDLYVGRDVPPMTPDPRSTPEEQGLTPGGEPYPTPDPRLVAAFDDAIGKAIEGWKPARPLFPLSRVALPAFLADPRTHEWLAERLALLPAELQGASRLQAAAILGVEPGGAA